ncbi:MAG: nitrate/nitrite transporter NrtS [Hyphomicrobiaceae bacterium]
MSTTNSRAVITQTCSGPILKRILAAARVIGTVLSLINHGRSGLDGEINWFKAILTYFVPFFVASYGVYSAAKIAVQSEHIGQST